MLGQSLPSPVAEVSVPVRTSIGFLNRPRTTVFTWYFSASVPALNHRGQLDGAASRMPGQRMARSEAATPIRTLRISSDSSFWTSRVSSSRQS